MVLNAPCLPWDPKQERVFPQVLSEITVALPLQLLRGIEKEKWSLWHKKYYNTDSRAPKQADALCRKGWYTLQKQLVLCCYALVQDYLAISHCCHELGCFIKTVLSETTWTLAWAGPRIHYDMSQKSCIISGYRSFPRGVCVCPYTCINM